MADRRDTVGTTTGQPPIRCIRRNTQQHSRNGLSVAVNPGNPVVTPIAATQFAETDWQLSQAVIEKLALVFTRIAAPKAPWTAALPS